jgi:hypothetical protein
MMDETILEFLVARVDFGAGIDRENIFHVLTSGPLFYIVVDTSSLISNDGSPIFIEKRFFFRPQHTEDDPKARRGYRVFPDLIDIAKTNWAQVPSLRTDLLPRSLHGDP